MPYTPAPTFWHYSTYQSTLSLGQWVGPLVPTAGDGTRLFPTLTYMPLLVGAVRYRCLFVVNYSSLTLPDVRVFVSSQPLGDSRIAVGVDPTAAALFRTTTTAPQLAVNPPAPPAPPAGTPPWVPNPVDGVAPPGVSFSEPATASTGTALGDLPAYSCRAVWMRWTVPALPVPESATGFTLCCSYLPA